MLKIVWIRNFLLSFLKCKVRKWHAFAGLSDHAANIPQHVISIAIHPDGESIFFTIAALKIRSIIVRSQFWSFLKNSSKVPTSILPLDSSTSLWSLPVCLKYASEMQLIYDLYVPLITSKFVFSNFTSSSALIRVTQN